MAPSVGLLPGVDAPFPGLRAFDVEEALLFFGREAHTEALLGRLSKGRFLAVVGSSGCGKSSLVRAGLLPALLRGYLVDATSRWRSAILRPGIAPLDALAAALAKDGVAGAQDEPSVRKTLGATSGGLVEVVRNAGLAPRESLLVIVDQFEEIFRYAREGGAGRESEVTLFVASLLRAVESDVPVYVTITMRSDFQGDCAQFAGLPEALNRSQYLVPRLTRDERRDAITRPLDLFDAAATPRLVNRLLNDAGDDPDQLPVLQHALLRTYRYWKEKGGQGELDLAHYTAIGGIANALGNHGDMILGGFGADDQQLAERTFRCLTTTERGRVVRRPRELAALYDVVGARDEATQARVAAIVSAFAHREHSLLILSSARREPGTFVDVTHESLMRKWPALAGWVREEARSAEWYRDLARDVVRHRTGDAGLWRDPELSAVLQRRQREGWNQAWARQYGPAGDESDPLFDEVEKFLATSVERQEDERRREALQRRRGTILLLLLLVTLITTAAVVFWMNRRSERREERLTSEYLKFQKQYNEAQRVASRMEARSKEIERQLAKAPPQEWAQLRHQLEELRKQYDDSQAQAAAYQRQATERRGDEALKSSDHDALLERVQSLQRQLNNVTAERDELRYSKASAAGVPDRDLVNRVDDLTAQLGAARAEIDKLRVEGRPVFVTVAQNSIVHARGGPYTGNVAIGVGKIHSDPSSHFRIYVWTTDDKRSLPGVLSGPDRFVWALGYYGIRDVPEEPCGSDGPNGVSCYRVNGGAIAKGSQQPGSFTFRGTRYEIRATGWHGDVSGLPDTVTVALYLPTSSPATAR